MKNEREGSNWNSQQRSFIGSQEPKASYDQLVNKYHTVNTRNPFEVPPSFRDLPTRFEQKLENKKRFHLSTIIDQTHKNIGANKKIFHKFLTGLEAKENVAPGTYVQQAIAFKNTPNWQRRMEEEAREIEKLEAQMNSPEFSRKNYFFKQSGKLGEDYPDPYNNTLPNIKPLPRKPQPYTGSQRMNYGTFLGEEMRDLEKDLKISRERYNYQGQKSEEERERLAEKERKLALVRANYAKVAEYSQLANFNNTAEMPPEILEQKKALEEAMTKLKANQAEYARKLDVFRAEKDQESQVLNPIGQQQESEDDIANQLTNASFLMHSPMDAKTLQRRQRELMEEAYQRRSAESDHERILEIEKLKAIIDNHQITPDHDLTKLVADFDNYKKEQTPKQAEQIGNYEKILQQLAEEEAKKRAVYEEKYGEISDLENRIKDYEERIGQRNYQKQEAARQEAARQEAAMVKAQKITFPNEFDNIKQFYRTLPPDLDPGSSIDRTYTEGNMYNMWKEHQGMLDDELQYKYEHFHSPYNLYAYGRSLKIPEFNKMLKSNNSVNANLTNHDLLDLITEYFDVKSKK